MSPRKGLFCESTPKNRLIKPNYLLIELATDETLFGGDFAHTDEPFLTAM